MALQVSFLVLYCLRTVRGILKCILVVKRRLPEPSTVIEGKFEENFTDYFKNSYSHFVRDYIIFSCYGYLRHNAGQRFRVGIHICTNLVRYNKFLDSDKDCFHIRQYLVNKINKSPSLHKKGKEYNYSYISFAFHADFLTARRYFVKIVTYAVLEILSPLSH